MSLLTKYNVNEHCRTCLKRLIGGSLNTSTVSKPEETSDNKDLYFNIHNDAELKQLICTYVDDPFGSETSDLRDKDFPENVCLACFDKLHNFAAFRKRAQKSAEKLRTVLNCHSGRIKVEINYEVDELEGYKEGQATSTLPDYKVQFKEALMENEEVFFETSPANLAEMELNDHPADPFAPSAPALSDCSSSMDFIENEDIEQQEEEVDKEEKDEQWEKEDNEIKQVKEEINKNQLDTKEEISILIKKDLFKCTECNQCYALKSELEAHVQQKHDTVNKLPYACGHCDKTYRFIRSLQEHMKQKHQAVLNAHGQFKCSLCPKAFLSDLSLKKHMCFHIREDMSRVCGICSKRFPVKNLLVEHLRTHSNDGRIPCGQCDKSFLWYQDLLNHELSYHLKEKPFPCKLCDKSFQTQKSLRFHSYRHSGEKPYLCDVCGKDFRQPTAMKQHRLNHFKNDKGKKS